MVLITNRVLSFFWVIPTVILCFFTGCKKEDDLPAKADRTVLVYMVADNSLYQNVDENIDSIAAGYASLKTAGNMLVYLDDLGEDGILYLYEKDKKGNVSRKTVKTYPEPWISTSPSNMSQVLKDAFGSYPAGSYGLVLWSHALSWIPANKVTTYSWGEDDGYNINIADLSRVLQSVPGVHFDFLLFDACFMSTVEVAYELRNTADYIIAAPTELLEFGFPYKSLVSRLFDYSDPVSLARCFAGYYDGTKKQNGIYNYQMDGTMSVVRCSEMENLARLTRSIVTAHAGDVYSVTPAAVQRYFRLYSDNFAYDFRDYIGKFATDAEMSSLDRQLEKTVVYKYATDYFMELRIDKDRYSGIASYILQKNGVRQSWDRFYPTLGWYEAAGLNTLY